MKIEKLNTYWKKMKTIKLKTNKYPHNVFNFVSIHKNNKNVYSLISPMLLVNLKKGNRPYFENHNFNEKNNCIEYAKILANQHNINIVDCT